MAKPAQREENWSAEDFVVSPSNEEIALLLSRALGSFAPFLRLHPEAVTAARIHGEMLDCRDRLIKAMTAQVKG